jgi:hypothetical protein
MTPEEFRYRLTNRVGWLEKRIAAKIDPFARYRRPTGLAQDQLIAEHERRREQAARRP